MGGATPPGATDPIQRPPLRAPRASPRVQWDPRGAGENPRRPLPTGLHCGRTYRVLPARQAPLYRAARTARCNNNPPGGRVPHSNLIHPLTRHLLFGI